MKAWQSFVFRWCSGWVELEGKAERKKGGWVFFFFLLPLNSLWLCQSVLKQPFSFLADSSTIPSEMLIWQLSAPSSAFPSLTSLYLRDEIALARPFFVPMSPLLKVHTQKQSLNSDLFRISTNVGEGQRLCKILHLPWQKNKQKHPAACYWTLHLVTIRQRSDLSLCWTEKSQFLEPLSALRVDESYNFSRFSKHLLTVLSVYLNPQGAR